MPALGIARLRRRAESSGQGLPCMVPAAGLRTWASTWPGTSVACTSPRAARSPPAVYVRLRGDAAYDLASMHDVAVCEWRCCAAAQLQLARAAHALAGRSSGGGVPTPCSQLRPSPPPLPTPLLPLADIGSSNPIQVDGKTVWLSTNQLCRRWEGQLGSRKGELVVLGCAVPLSGRYVGIEIE